MYVEIFNQRYRIFDEISVELHLEVPVFANGKTRLDPPLDRRLDEQKKTVFLAYMIVVPLWLHFAFCARLMTGHHMFTKSPVSRSTAL
jgi:hypothetical protein